MAQPVTPPPAGSTALRQNRRLRQHRRPRDNSKTGLAVTEVPSWEHARIYGESNLNTFRDGRRVLKTILTEWRRRSA